MDTNNILENNNQKNITNITKYEDFDDMKLEYSVLRGIYGYGFEKPSIIQQQAIVPMISGKDIIAQAHSGTGKTGTFIIGVLNKIEKKIRECKKDKYEIIGCHTIIVSPTRELAYQTINVCKELAKFIKVNIVACIGGTSTKENQRNLSEGTIVAIGTPGRILDMMYRGYLSKDTIKTLILDEADELLRKNFQDQLKIIITSLNKDTQICLFSATMPKEVIQLAKEFMNDPVSILVEQNKLTLRGITQYYINVKRREYKFNTICDLFKNININQSIIYANSIRRVEDLQRQLISNNFTVSAIHGKMSQDIRRAIMKDFKSGKTRVLVATDLLARGIDVNKVTLVINYDLPRDVENYLHRIGRSGRFGKRGTAINFITHKDFYILRDIETYYSIKIDPMPKIDKITF